MREHDNEALWKDMFSISQIAATLSLAGKISVSQHRDIAEALQFWAAYVRNEKNKTYTAIVLGKSRLSVRRVVRLIESDESRIPATVRRLLLRDPVRPSFNEIVADLTHRSRTLEGKYVDDSA